MRTKIKEGSRALHRVPVDAVALRTIDDTASQSQIEECSGQFVRIKPSQGATRDAVNTLVKSVREVALGVKVLPIPHGDRLPMNQPVRAVVSKNLRQVMNELVTGSKHETELKEYLSSLADKAGI